MTGFQFSDETLSGLEHIQGAHGMRRGKVDKAGNNRLTTAITSIGGGSSTPKANRNQRAFEALERVTRHSPQTVVKITGRIHGSAGVLGSFVYVSRLSMKDQDVQPLETSEGKLLTRADEMMALAREWHLHEMADEARRKGATAISMVFSMPPGTDAAKVYDAVREFAEQDMSNRRWAMVLHTDEAHPHVHVIVANRDHNGRRFNPNREFLRQCRDRFAENLRARGVEADATRRAARGFPPRRETMATRKIRERDGASPETAITRSDPHRAENVGRITTIYMQAIEELERYGGDAHISCSKALRNLVASISISPDSSRAVLSERSKATLDQLTKTVEKIRLSTAELNEKSRNAATSGITASPPDTHKKLSQQTQKLERMILDRQRTITHQLQREKDRDIDGPTR